MLFSLEMAAAAADVGMLYYGTLNPFMKSTLAHTPVGTVGRSHEYYCEIRFSGFHCE